jgi:serine/threonine-protein kinase RsbW
LVASLADGRTVWSGEMDPGRLATMAVDDHHLAVLDELGLADVISVPFVVDGRVLGAVTLFADRRRGPFIAADVEVAEQLAVQVALVIDKAQRYEAEVRTSHALQRSLLPARPPAITGLEIAARYLPATQGVEVGGDFYDVVVLPDGTVAIAVGDVVGHDLAAAATMGQLTSVHRALLADLPSPSAVVRRLQASWSLLGLHRMATVLFADLDTATGRLRMASAGHLAPLLLHGDRAELLPVRPARLLGAPPAPHPPAEWTGLLPRGGTLLMFTDGLVESRSEDLDAGLARLVAVAGDARTADPEALCDRLLAELTGSHRADDIALLALTRSA